MFKGIKPKMAVGTLIELFQDYISNRVQISFDQHIDIQILNSIEVGIQTDIKGLLPDKRIDEDGKKYTPAVVLFIFERCTLALVLEDIEQIIQGTDYKIIPMCKTQIELKLCK